MTYNYAPLATKTVALIAKYGKEIVLEFTDPDAVPADANKPWRGSDDLPITARPKCVQTTFDRNEIDGERIKATDIKVIIAAQDAQMEGVDVDRVLTGTLGDKAYGATNVSEIVPGDTSLLFTLRLRQA